jgi:hypothetical protein
MKNPLIVPKVLSRNVRLDFSIVTPNLLTLPSFFPCRKVSRSVSIPPILEGDTDQWEEENSLEKDKKQNRKR